MATRAQAATNFAIAFQLMLSHTATQPADAHKHNGRILGNFLLHPVVKRSPPRAN